MRAAEPVAARRSPDGLVRRLEALIAEGKTDHPGEAMRVLSERAMCNEARETAERLAERSSAGGGLSALEHRALEAWLACEARRKMSDETVRRTEAMTATPTPTTSCGSRSARRPRGST